jgi:glutamate/tyrosine decarboxylase-like PLP-dependent enzyme
LLDGGKIALYVRRFRPTVSLLLIHAWLIVRFLSIQPKQSLLELGVEWLSTMRDYVMETTPQRFTGILLWIWRLFEDWLAFLLFCSTARVFYCLYHYSINEWTDLAISSLFEWAKRNVPGVQSELDKQVETFQTDADRLLNKDPERTLTLELPATGRSHDDILKELESFALKEDQKWREGKVSGTVYSNERRHSEFLAQIYKLYSWANPLHPGFWPKMNQCEAEVIAMTSKLLHGSNIGCVTSGGTESILLAVRAHVVWGKKQRGIVYPEIVCSKTAHAALNKACEMFGIRQVSIDCLQLTSKLAKREITSNTIMIYASAPNYPQGIMDDIESLSKLAVEFDIGLHVDACLGGFVLPFSDNVPPFDFLCPGVTTMSADTHKFGYASKGTSVVLYRTAALRHCSYFSYPHW